MICPSPNSRRFSSRPLSHQAGRPTRLKWTSSRTAKPASAASLFSDSTV